MNKKGIWSGAIGALDPIIEKIAQDMAKKVPKNSPLRSGMFKLAQGVAKGLLETFTEKLPPPVAIAIEKLTDFSDFFSGALGSIPEKDKKVVTEDWMKKFFVDAGFRLKNKKAADDQQKEFERIKTEFKLRCKLLKLIEATQPKPSASEPTKSWQEMFREWEKQFREFSQGFEEFTKEVDKVLGINAEAKKINNVLSPIRDTLRVDITEEKRRWFRWN